MATNLGDYLNKLKSNKAKISRNTGISTNRINTICNEENAILYGDELYKVLAIANKSAGLPDTDFNRSIEEIFPLLEKISLLEELNDLSPIARFFGKYTQKQTDIERKLGMPNGKISKYFNDNTKRALAVEIISFSTAMEMDYLTVFKEIYGEISGLQKDLK